MLTLCLLINYLDRSNVTNGEPRRNWLLTSHSQGQVIPKVP